MNDQLFVLASQKKKTSHILHLLLCIPTMGFWVIVWVLIGVQNSMHNSAIDRKMQRIINHKSSGLSDAETHVAIGKEDQYKNKVILAIMVFILLIIYLSSRH
jgi:hypothetical protein